MHSPAKTEGNIQTAIKIHPDFGEEELCAGSDTGRREVPTFINNASGAHASQRTSERAIFQLRERPIPALT